MSTKAKIILGVLGTLLVIGMLTPDKTESFCDAHPNGAGIKTLDEKYDWVMKCNDGKPARK